MLDLDGVGAHALAGLCAFGGVAIALYQICMHLRLYNEPALQRYIVRIVFMVPVYAVASFLSLVNPSNSIYYESIRDVYEAWVIYNFLALLLVYVGGPGAVEVKLSGHVLSPSIATCNCCMPPLVVNGMFVKTTKRMALQFVLFKPLLAVTGLVLYSVGHYEEGNWAPNNWYLWETLLNNMTYSVALYGLVLFYKGCHELLAPYKPLLKFVLIKAVIFVTFWQGFMLAVLESLGWLPPELDSGRVQTFLICCEMLPASVFMVFAFPWGIYSVAGQETGLKTRAVGHVLSIGDVVTDTMHHFAPNYRDYVLYSDGQDGGGTSGAARGVAAGGTSSVRSKTRIGKHADLQGPAGPRDKASLLMHMEMGSRWRTTEEAALVDFATLGQEGSPSRIPAGTAAAAGGGGRAGPPPLLPVGEEEPGPPRLQEVLVAGRMAGEGSSRQAVLEPVLESSGLSSADSAALREMVVPSVSEAPSPSGAQPKGAKASRPQAAAAAPGTVPAVPGAGS